MQIIVKCPECGKGTLAHAGAGYTSEIITTETKKCSGCNAQLEIKIKIVATVVKPEAAKKG
jgi:predicted RNA-binding Zn-ribbon protein involved in translation (DUF1610 family)